MVGENLGGALITLMHSMHEFRSKHADNVQDLMDYLDEEGYLNLRNHPIHALAVLHLAETFQLRDMYIDAFAHCCGMSDQLFTVPEYQVSGVPTRLIKCESLLTQAVCISNDPKAHPSRPSSDESKVGTERDYVRKFSSK